MPRLRHGSGDAAAALAHAAPLVSRWIERLLAGHEPPLTVPQYLVLQSVAEGDIVGSELARRAGVSPAAISQLLDTLALALARGLTRLAHALGGTAPPPRPRRAPGPKHRRPPKR
jgi:hypothetical protein